MSHHDTLQGRGHTRQDLPPPVPRPEQKALAALVTGVVLAPDPGLFAAGAAAPGPSHDRGKSSHPPLRPRAGPLPA